MKNLTGKKWGEISEELQEKLLTQANCVDGRTGNNQSAEGECIVDFENFSITGKIVGGEILIDLESEFYDPTK